MALREIRQIGDEILSKKAKPVKEMTERIRSLIDDMFDTMYEENGVGLAGPQVGILKRIFVVDTGLEGECFVCINPQITVLDKEEAEDKEGCLSVPGKQGMVRRPSRVRVDALDEDFEPFSVECEGLLARAMQHEYDHLDGILYTSRVIGDLEDVNYETEGE